MSQTRPQPKLRADYQPPAHRVESVDLHFDLGEELTVVSARLSIARAKHAPADAPLVLSGQELELRIVRLDGRELPAGEYEIAGEELRIQRVPARFDLETEVAVRPRENTALEGLYVSNGIFCTQCEAEGFRRITYFPDRPDVMARYTTTIVADAERCPVMLSNGNRIDGGRYEDGRHWVKWRDPFPKPSYLFALVAGDLACHAGSFTTGSGRSVRLEVWVEPRNADRCAHALASLQKAMRWDEERFGLEYDLGVYMIVAVSDFNMGAMENKGLNVFNSKFVLARPETATDDDYEAIEGVIAHEYFHNWTGNRVTCRDWFQLTLKEGLTVFRDQQFSMETTSPPVKRIADVVQLRDRQFTEDAGPMAHPIRPEQYVEMNNFYTATVYEKGAEVVRMYQTLLGVEGFRRGMDLYFERHDGQAVTCDDFRAAMADANGRDLAQFERWYLQAGTPVLSAHGEYDAAERAYTLTLRQDGPRRPGRPEFQPLHVPVAVGLLGPDGAGLALRLEGEPSSAAVTTRVLELVEAEQRFRFADVPAPPVASILRGFSAPVRLAVERGREELAFLLAHDADPVARWDAGQELARGLLLELARAVAEGRALALDPLFVEAWGRVLADESLDGSMRALSLRLPSERQLAQEIVPVDPGALLEARNAALRALGRAHRDALEELYRALAPRGPYRADRASIDARRLRNAALSFLTALDEPATTALASAQIERADNMTDVEAALACLVEAGGPARDEALERFHARWHADPLVLDKWFRLQAQSSRADTVERVMALAGHRDFTWRNPNRVRALVATFGLLNHARFHSPDGRGYAFVADAVIRLDGINPQVAARIAGAFLPWQRYEPGRRALLEGQLHRIADRTGLSRDVGEIVERALQ